MLTVHRLVVGLTVRIELAVGEVVCDVQEVCDLQVAGDGDFEAKFLKYLGHVFPDAISFTARNVLKDRKTIISI